MIDYIEYMGYDVEIKDKDGDIFKGKLISYDHGYDEEPEVDYDSLGIQIYEEACIVIPIPDIREFKVIEEQ
ncbi:MAG: hypothetical protein MSA89_12255 [Clostridium sp.]|nr:hypothetical protein [Clostridium sp.]MCI7443830.1 hypothetical protein [Clostridium sp.]